MSEYPKRIVCYGCSLLCDDVYIDYNEKKQIFTVNGCFRGDSFLKRYNSENRLHYGIQKDMGLFMNVSASESSVFLTEKVNESQSIKFYGIGTLSYDSQISVMNFAHRLMKQGKLVKFENCANLIQIITKFGLNTSSIGQAINNADVFIFWKTDPTHSHPKLVGKLLFTRGLLRSSGKEVKKLILIEAEESDLTRLKDIKIDDKNYNPSDIVSDLKVLMASDDVSVVKIDDLDKLNKENLKEYIKATEFGFIVTMVPFDRDESHRWFEIISELLNLLNNHALGRFSLLPLTLMPNEMGQSMAALSIFSADQIQRLITQDGFENSDLAIVFGGEYLRDEYKIKDFEYPERTVILFDNFKSDISKRAKITIPYAVPGIEFEDLAIRFDGLNLKLIKWLDPPEEVWTINKIF